MNLLQLRDLLVLQTVIPYDHSQVDAYINQAYLDLASANDWPWLEATHVFSFDGSTEYPLPADFHRLRAVIYTGQGAEAQPTHTSRESVLARLGDNVGESDLPTEFYRQGSNLKFVPAATGAQEVVLLYSQSPAPLVADEDEPLFAAPFHLYLTQAAAADYFESEESFEYAGYWHSKAADTFARMLQFYDLQMPSEPLIVGDGIRLRRPKPFTTWPS